MGRNTMVASFLLRLRDLVSPGLRVVQQRLNAVREAAGRIGAIGAVVGAISFLAPIREAAAFDQRLRDIAVTAGQAGAEAQRSIRDMARQFGGLAVETGQRSSAVAEAAGVLIAAGMERGLIDSLLPTIARVATATNSSITDIATTAFTLSDTLRVGPEQMESALAAMVTAGKEGRFELRAMAREFPQLTAAAAALGLTGRTAVDSLSAALQVARRGAGSESEAANNLANFLSRLTSPETVRNFREAGVDIERVLADATARGLNPIEAVIQKLREVTGGNMFRVGEIFGDQQVQNFIRPMLAGVEEYLRIRDIAANATPAIIGTDFGTQMEGPNRQLEVFNEQLGQLGNRVGIAFSRVQAAMTPALAEINRLLGILDERMPGLIENVLSFGGGGVLLTAALGAIGFVAPAVAEGVGLVTAAIKLLLAPLRLAFLGMVALLGPWGAAALAIATAAYLIWQYWDPISEFFSGLWTRLQTLFSAFSGWIDGWTGGAMTAAVAAIRAAWEPLAAWFDGLWSRITDSFDAVYARIRPAIDAIGRVLGSAQGAGANPAFQPAAQAERRERGGSAGLAAAAAAMWNPIPAPAQRVQGEIVVRAAPGTEVERAATNDRALPLTTAPNRGPMLGLP
jgi:TP901 family phage tail tape measure protein